MLAIAEMPRSNLDAVHLGVMGGASGRLSTGGAIDAAVKRRFAGSGRGRRFSRAEPMQGRRYSQDSQYDYIDRQSIRMRPSRRYFLGQEIENKY